MSAHVEPAPGIAIDGAPQHTPRSRPLTPTTLLVALGMVVLMLPYRWFADAGALMIIVAVLPPARPNLARVPLMWWLFLAWCALSVLWSVSVNDSQLEAQRLVLLGVAGALLGVGLPWLRTLTATALAASVGSAWSVATSFTSPATAYADDGTLKGVFTHGNVLGWVAAVGIFALVQVAATSRSRLLWALSLPCAAACVAALAMAQSATSLLCLLAGLATTMMFGVSRRVDLPRRRLLWPTLGLFLVTVTLATAANVALFTSAVGRDATLTGRTEIWPRVVEFISQSPWTGHGVGAAWAVGSPIREQARMQLGGAFVAAHDSLLELLLEVGVIGLALLVCCLLPALVRWLRAANRTATGAAGLGLFVLALVHGIAESSVKIQLEWLLLGAFVSWLPTLHEADE